METLANVRRLEFGVTTVVKTSSDQTSSMLRTSPAVPQRARTILHEQAMEVTDSVEKWKAAAEAMRRAQHAKRPTGCQQSHH